ncbi:MAG: TauD/TfdA family dioxygenase, partial [Flavobacteriales bacterium]|nr:TauD/TfdA family dioxygenase [Flavobacteriales bacterium]
RVPGAGGKRHSTRYLYRNPKGDISAERWEIHGAGHAWAGGSASGSYTDQSGPNATAEMLRPLTAFHNLKAYNQDDLNNTDTPDAEHPVILHHPDTGREILYVNRSNTRRIADLPGDESDDLLNQLYAHQTQAEFVYDHQWQVGDFVVFDTLGTQHRRLAFDPSERRIMRQLSTMWTTPTNTQGRPAIGE